MDYRLEIARHYYSTTSKRGTTFDMATLQHGFHFLARKIGDWLPKEKNFPIIDLACGCGELMIFLQQQGYKNVYGMDLCEEELAVCRSRGLNNAMQGDIRQALKTYRDHFQLITAFNILEHLTKQEVVDILHDIYSALRPGGRLIAVVPNAHSPLGQQARYWDFTHELAFCTSSWNQLAPLAGFEIPQFKELCPSPHGFFSLIRYALWQVFRAGIMFYNLVETASIRGGIYSQDMYVMLQKKS